MKKSAKLFTLLLVSFMVLLAGCGGTASQTPPASGAEASPAETSAAPAVSTAEPAAKADLLVSRWAGPHADFQKEIVKEYAGGKITIDDVDYGNLKQKQLLSFQAAAGTAGNYDVVWVNSQWMKEYTDAGYLYELNDLIKETGLDTGIYNKGMMDGCVFDGRIYGLPTYAQCLIIAYDSAAFEKEGLKVPANTAELIEVAKHFKEKGSGIAIPAKQATASFTLWSQLLFSSGGYYFDKDGRLDLTSEVPVFAAGVYDELAKYAVNGALTWAHDETAEAVRTGVAPIGVIMSGLANQNHDPEKSRIVDTVKYATLNGKDGKTAANNAFWVWAVPKNAKDPKASLEFISWFTSPEIEKKQTIANQQISAIDSLSKDAEVLSKAPFLPAVMEEFAGGRMDPALANFSKLKDAVSVGLSELASTNAKPADVMKKVQDSLKDIDFSK